MKKGVKVRVALQEFTLEGRSHPKGTMLALRWDNEHLSGFDQIIKSGSEIFERATQPIGTGLVDSGKDLGSDSYQLLKSPRVALLGGRQSRSYDFGQVWYFMEQDLEYPVTVIDADDFGRVDKNKYDVILVPGGFYDVFGDDGRKEIKEWIANGGRLVVMGSALRSFVDKDEFGLKRYRTEDEQNQAERKEEAEIEASLLLPYEDIERESLSGGLPGAIYKVRMDNSHPLAFGYGKEYFSLKLSTSRYAYLEDGWNVGVVQSATDLTAGFVGSKVKDDLAQTLVFGVEEIGDGSVVYMVDNPLFRAFWHRGKMLVGNAIFIR